MKWSYILWCSNCQRHIETSTNYPLIIDKPEERLYEISLEHFCPMCKNCFGFNFDIEPDKYKASYKDWRRFEDEQDRLREKYEESAREFTFINYSKQKRKKLR